MMFSQSVPATRTRLHLPRSYRDGVEAGRLH